MSKASSILSLFEEKTVTVALFSFRHKTNGKYFEHIDIFGFELWDVPVSSDSISDATVCKNPYELFSNMLKLSKPKLRKYNPTKQRIGLQRHLVSNVVIPDNVWIKLGIDDPSEDQTLLMQCLVVLYKQHNVRIFGLDSSQLITDLRS